MSLEMIIQFMEYEAISINFQKIIIFLLSTCENIRDHENSLGGCNCGKTKQISLTLLKRCLKKKYEDSELRQR